MEMLSTATFGIAGGKKVVDKARLWEPESSALFAVRPNVVDT